MTREIFRKLLATTYMVNTLNDNKALAFIGVYSALIDEEVVEERNYDFIELGIVKERVDTALSELINGLIRYNITKDNELKRVAERTRRELRGERE